MRTVLVLVATAGCNSVFGIETTGIQDAPPMVAVDAAPPPVCPSDGSPPTFHNELYQVPAKYCLSYAVSQQAGTAAAMCLDANNMYTAGSGEADGELTAAVFAQPMAVTPFDVRLSPEGDHLYVSGQDANGYGRIEQYTLDAGTWQHSDEAMLSAPQFYPVYISPPSAGPDRRIMEVTYDTSGTEKTVELGPQWTQVSTVDYTTLQVDNIAEPSLSADGLRFVFVSGTTASTTMLPPQQATGTDSNITCCGGSTTYERDVYIVTRPSTNVPFATKAQKIASVPSEVSWPYMTEDCGRIYFSALNTVFYLKQ